MAQLRSILDYKHVITGIWGCRPTPLLKEEGWTRHQERCREATFDGADGVVTHDETFRLDDHPVCGNKVGFAAFFFNAAATPPVSGGEFARLRAPLGRNSFSLRPVGRKRGLKPATTYVAALCACLLIPLSLHAQVTKTEHFNFPPGGVLHVANSTDELTIEGWDCPDAEITTIKSKKIYATKEQETADLDRIQITAQQRGNELVVTTDFPRYDVFPPPLPFRGGRHFELEYHIHVPRSASVIVDHDAGEVHIDNIAGDIRVKVQKGQINLRLPEDNSYTIDAKADIGNVYSDFPGRWHRRIWPLGARYEQASAGSHKLYLRSGFGDIAILKIRRPPWGLQQ